ncbi:diacylglycerol kinase [Thaumasiovibrio sp. DFM-14]|uniref:diacylglycerol kinase n=1 Tax=Thaumasiovibrio sp. DFM-14 TaxID=3384792 RepID=UPI0039A03E57
MQKATGIKRLILAARYSVQGLRSTFVHEVAFRQELILALFMIPLAFWLEVNTIQRILLVGTVVLVLIVELLNSAIEAIVDRIGIEQHPLSGRAKDAGSAAVLMALILCGYVWLEVLLV